MPAKTFLIQSPHNEKECLQALDEIAATKSREILDNAFFACMAGDHTCWTTVKANSVEEAKNMVPSNLRNKARVTEVSKFSRDQIKSFHNK